MSIGGELALRGRRHVPSICISLIAWGLSLPGIYPIGWWLSIILTWMSEHGLLPILLIVEAAMVANHSNYIIQFFTRCSRLSVNILNFSGLSIPCCQLLLLIFILLLLPILPYSGNLLILDDASKWEVLGPKSTIRRSGASRQSRCLHFI